MRLYCVDCDQVFTDLATYQGHVHPSPAKGVAWGCAIESALVAVGALVALVIVEWVKRGARF